MVHNSSWNYLLHACSVVSALMSTEQRKQLESRWYNYLCQIKCRVKSKDVQAVLDSAKSVRKLITRPLRDTFREWELVPVHLACFVPKFYFLYWLKVLFIVSSTMLTSAGCPKLFFRSFRIDLSDKNTYKSAHEKSSESAVQKSLLKTLRTPWPVLPPWNQSDENKQMSIDLMVREFHKMREPMKTIEKM